MPTIDEIRTVTIKAITQDVDKATSDINKLSDAQSGLAVQSDNTSRAQTSVTNALNRQQSSLDANYRAQKQYNQSQLDITRAYNEGVISADRFNQLTALNAQRFEDATGKIAPFQKALQGVQLQMVAMSANIGPLGILLAGMGPLGLAAAVGIDLITKSIEYLVSEANRMGDVSRQVRDLSDTLRISSDDLQQLQHAGAAVGLTSDDIGRSFERFAVGLGSLRDGTGTLYTELQRVNPSLVTQLAVTKDNATAWNLLAQAYSQADSQQQALIAHAAFGRGGAATGRLLSATASAGGISGLETPADLISQADVDKWAALKTQIDQTNKITKDLMAEIFTPDVLAREKQAADTALEWAKALKDGSVSVNAIGQSNFGEFPGALGQPAPLGVGPSSPAAAPAGATFNQRFGSLPAATPNAEFQANQAKATISALGAAASAYEQNRAKVLELDSALEHHTITQQTYNRAVAGLNLQTVIQLESQRNALLGQATTVMDVVKQKEDEIAAANMRGAGISSTQATGILAAAAAQKIAADTQILTTNNVVSAEQLRIAKLAELNAAILQGKLTQDQANISLAAYEKVIEQTIQSQNVAKATFTNLAQLQQTAGSLRGQLDTFATDTSNNIGSAFVDIATGAKSAKDAFANLEAQVIKSLVNMMVQFAIVKPIAMGFESILGGAFNLGSGVLSGGLPLGSGGIGHAHSGGVIGIDALAGKYVHPAYFDDAPRFHGGGMVGADEVPIVAKRGEGVFTPGQMAAMGGANVEVNINVQNQNGSDVQVQKQKNNSGGVDLMVLVRDATNQNIASGAHDKAMRSRFGATPVGQSR